MPPAGERSVPERSPLEPPLLGAIEHLTRFARFLHFTRSDEGLARQVAATSAHALAAEWNRLTRHQTDRQELPGSDLGRTIAAFAARYPDESTQWQLLGQSLAQCRNTDSDLYRAIRSRVQRRWREQIARDWTDQKARVLRKTITPLVSVLNETVADLAEVRTKLRSLMGLSGDSWDLVHANWRGINWQGLEGTAAFLRSNSSVTRLAQIVARGFPSAPVEEPHRAPAASGRRHASPATPSGRPAFAALSPVEPAFALALGEGSSWSGPALYLQQKSTAAANLRAAAESPRFPAASLCASSANPPTGAFASSGAVAPTGVVGASPETAPVIICLDTSGSMAGPGVQVSKSLTLAVAALAHEYHRSAHLFVSAGTLLHLELTRPEASLVRYSAYLEHSDSHGTDIGPPLAAALDFIENGRLPDPDDSGGIDVILVSDFRFPTIAPGHLNRMFFLQAHHRTRFHALTVHHRPMEDPLNVFDYRWHYNTGDHNQIGINPEAFRGL